MLPFSRVGEIIHSQPRQEAHVQALNVHQHFCVFQFRGSHFPVNTDVSVCVCLCVYVCVCLRAEVAA